MPFLLIGIIILLLGPIVAALLLWRPIYLRIRERKESRLAALEAQRKRLKVIVGELLRKADEIDQESKYVDADLSAEWHEAFTHVCTELVTLGEVVDALGPRIVAKDVKTTRKKLLQSANVANSLLKKLQKIRLVTRSAEQRRIEQH